MSTALLSIVIGVGGMFGWGFYDFLGGVYSKRIGSFKSLFWSQLAGLIGLIALLCIVTVNYRLSGSVILLLCVASMMYAGGYLLFFRGLEIGNVSIVAATMNLWAVFTMLFAFLFMGQRLSAMQSLGVCMIISGVILASLNWQDICNHTFKPSLGVKETILGAFLFGVFWNISEVVSENIGWLPTTLFVKFGIIGFLLLFSVVIKKELKLTKIAKKTKIMVLLMGVIETGTVAMVNYGMTIGDAILITPIASALSIVTIALAIVFLKDRVTKLQGFGMTTAVTGIIVTAF